MGEYSPVTFVSLFAFESFHLTATAVPELFTGLIMLALGVGVALRDRSSSMGRLFVLLTLATSTWFLAFAMMHSAKDDSLALVWARIAYLGVPFIGPIAFHFTMRWLRVSGRELAVALGYLTGLTFSFLALSTDWLLSGLHHYSWGVYPSYGPAGLPFLIFFASLLLATVMQCVIRLRATFDPNERALIRTVIFGFGVGYLAAVDFLPKYGIGIYPFGFFPLLIFIVLAARVIGRLEHVEITPSFAAKEIVQTMADAVIVCDRDGRIQIVNHAVRSLFGFEDDELIGHSIEALVDPDTTLASVDRLRQALMRGTLRDQERVFRTKSGMPIEVSISISQLKSGNSMAGSVVIARDIRDRKRSENEIKQTVSLLQSTLESTANGILVIDRSGRIVSYNQRFLEMWKITRSAVHSGDGNVLFGSLGGKLADPTRFLAAIDELEAHPERESFDLIEFAAGQTFERYSQPQWLEGKVVGRVWSFHDITERKRAEEAVRASEERYRLLFERNLAGVYRSNLSGAIIDCNEAFARILGFDSEAQLKGSSTTEFYADPKEREAVISLLRAAGSLTGIEVGLKRKDGSRIWVLENITLVAREGKEPAFLEGTIVDISDRKRAEEQIEFHAYHDVLTCLPNRRLFTDRLTLALAQARRSGRKVVVMFLDLDHFKIINDTLGHTAGDELLVTISERLKAAVREGDTVARLGGDEFTILTDLIDPDDAARIAQKILDAIEEPISLGDRQLYVTASLGIALYPGDGTDPESLLKNADSALYRAKEEGRNTYQLCTTELKDRAIERLSIENSLRNALDHGEFILHYQPLVSIARGRISGMEALIRWVHPDKGLLSPAGFIPVAEDSHVIIPIGRWVIEQACQQAKVWEDQGFPLRVAVNLSPRQFQQRELVSSVAETLAITGLSPDLLEFEITEGTAMQNIDFTIDILKQLRNMGLSISIDDFGTGYSSLNYLKRLPINTVKIDKSFVNDVTTDPGDAAIVSAIIGIARSLRLRVIAEGVETREQFRFLQKKQCEEMQGFLFGRPRAAIDVDPDLSSESLMSAALSDVVH